MLALLTNMQTAEEEKHEMQEMFTKIDKDEDGFISPEELQFGLGEIYGDILMGQFIMKQLITQMTLNDDGNVSFSDFMTTTAKREQYSNKNNLEDIFGMFKKSGYGLIHKDELSKALKTGYVDMESEIWD